MSEEEEQRKLKEFLDGLVDRDDSETKRKLYKWEICPYEELATDFPSEKDASHIKKAHKLDVDTEYLRDTIANLKFCLKSEREMHDVENRISKSDKTIDSELKELVELMEVIEPQNIIDHITLHIKVPKSIQDVDIDKSPYKDWRQRSGVVIKNWDLIEDILKTLKKHMDPTSNIENLPEDGQRFLDPQTRFINDMIIDLRSFVEEDCGLKAPIDIEITDQQGRLIYDLLKFSCCDFENVDSSAAKYIRTKYMRAIDSK